MSKPILTLVGNLTGDPELRFTPSGAAVANFTVADTPRTYDAATREWKDGETLFQRCTVWREAAENVAETLTKGMRVIVQGELTARTYETREGQKRTATDLAVLAVGPDLRYASATVTRNARGGGSGSSGGGFTRTAAPAGEDPWAAPAAPSSGSSFSDEPPF